MNPYTLAQDGSTWSKWDLHVHTPETKLSNAYSTTSGADPWEKFIEKIDSSDVLVIGITDYFSIDNYEKFITLYSTKQHTVKKYFFPNIEFRLDVSVNKNAEEVNIHVIFNNDVPIQEIKRFLTHLNTNISISGSKIPCSQLQYSQFKTAAININDLKSSLKNVFGNRLCYIIGGACNNQGLRPDTKSPRKMNITDEIDRNCDFIFGGNQNCIYYLRTDRYENGEMALKKPVLAGCDAHSFNDLDTKLGKELFSTWIKAMPTFNGLRQILFEPEDRVKIRITEPDYKEPHNIIKNVSISDDNHIFGNQIININKNLNTIIGGKSSGKSLLLYSVAKSIDLGQVMRLHEKFPDFIPYDIDNMKVNITWSDGITDTNNVNDYWDVLDTTHPHKITYIPQLYINYLAEKNGRDELNNLIYEILLQNDEFKAFKVDMDSKIDLLNEHISTAITNLLELRYEIIANFNEKKNYSTPDVYDNEIKILNAEYEELNESSSFSKEEMEDYKRIKSEINSCENNIRLLANEKTYLQGIKNEIIQRRDNLTGNREANIVGVLFKYLNKLNNSRINTSRIIEIIKIGYNWILQTIDKEFSIAKKDENISTITNEKTELEKEILKYDEKQMAKTEIAPVLQKIDDLGNKKIQIIELTDRYKTMMTEYINIKEDISKMLKERNQMYQLIKEYVNEKINILGTELLLSCSVSYPLNCASLYDMINRNYKNNYINQLFVEDSNIVNVDYLPTFFENIKRVENGKIIFNDNSEQQLKMNSDLEKVYLALAEDRFYINYDVTYRGDNLLRMSPGKKGTVLLMLFIELNSSDNPILIDQPEDNLDNRTIYDLLCKMIKNKKKNRQIIIVTHNANLVVNTDAENVIVANQEGQDPEIEAIDNRAKFEYINGPIEISFRHDKSNTVLTKIGIKQHVCDILEGGKEAFRLRERKYQEELDG
jgi:hypothetical protein